MTEIAMYVVVGLLVALVIFEAFPMLRDRLRLAAERNHKQMEQLLPERQEYWYRQAAQTAVLAVEQLRKSGLYDNYVTGGKAALHSAMKQQAVERAGQFLNAIGFADVNRDMIDTMVEWAVRQVNEAKQEYEASAAQQADVGADVSVVVGDVDGNVGAGGSEAGRSPAKRFPADADLGFNLDGDELGDGERGGSTG